MENGGFGSWWLSLFGGRLPPINGLCCATPVITFARMALCDLIALERASGHSEDSYWIDRTTSID